MKQVTYKNRAVIHGLSMAVFLGACLGLQADDKKISAEATVDTDSARVETTTDRKNDGKYSVLGDRNENNGKLSRSDAKFVREAAEGGLMEMRMGQSAKDHGSNADLKSFGEKLVKDHSQANDKLSKLAAEKGVNLAKDVDVKHTGKLKAWDAKAGTVEFDRAFIEHAVKDHKKHISEFEKASRDLNDSELRAFATATLPTLRGHLDEAQRIAKSIGLDIKVSDASEYGYDANGHGRIDARANAGSPGLSVEAQNSAVNRVDIDRDHKAKAEVNIDTDKNDGRTLGVDTQAGDNKTLGVETRAGDSKVLGIQTGPGDGKTLGLNTSKTDGKLLGAVDAPSANNPDAEVRVGDHKASVDVDVDRDKNDGKTLGVDAQTDDSKTLGVTTIPGDGKTLGLNTKKDDGKYLGIIPVPGANKPENRVDVDVDKTDHKVEVKSNIDTDRNVAIGAPASSEKGHKVEADVDVKNHDASINASAKTLSYKEIPSAVQDSIRKSGGNADVKDIKKHMMNGKTAYKVEWKQDGRNRVLHIAEDGTILKDNGK
jgi:putative membrane protein